MIYTLIDFDGMTTRLGLFYTKLLGIVFIVCFYAVVCKEIFSLTVQSDMNNFEQQFQP